MAKAIDEAGIAIYADELGPHPAPNAPRDGWVVLEGPVAIRRSDFNGPYEGVAVPSYALRPFVVDGRSLVLGVAFGVERPSDALLAEANRILATLEVDAAEAERATSALARACPRSFLGYVDRAGEWRATPPAAWLRLVLQEAGYPQVAETESGLVACADGHDFFLWTTGAEGSLAEVAEPGMRSLGELGGVPVYAGDKRGVWRVQGLDVWVEAGPTSETLPSIPAVVRLFEQSRQIPLRLLGQ
jgi:hypothetical protein